MPLVRRTRATLRSAELGFFGVVVYTRVHTPRRCGLPLSAGVFVLGVFAWRPLRTSWLIVGIRASSLPCFLAAGRPANRGAATLNCPGQACCVSAVGALPDPRGRVCRPSAVQCARCNTPE